MIEDIDFSLIIIDILIIKYKMQKGKIKVKKNKKTKWQKILVYAQYLWFYQYSGKGRKFCWSVTKE